MPTPPLYGDLDGLIGAVAADGHDVDVRERLPRIHLPFGAEAGHVVHLDGDRFFAYQFRTRTEAADHAWVRAHSVRTHHLVLESYPPDQWTDHQQFRRKPDRDIGWSPLLDDDGFVGLVQGAVADTPDTDVASFAAMLGSLTDSGYPVTHLDWLHAGQIYPGGEAGVACRIRRQRFLVYRYPDEARAEEFLDRLPAGVSAGPWVLRSDPATAYLAKETITLPPEKVDWSRLLEDDDFLAAVEQAAARSRTAARDAAVPVEA
jgi:hypothetical protein